MSTSEEMEHWRLRLEELVRHLKTTKGLNQRAVADLAQIQPDYLSRLLYVPGKKGRKNLGLDTMRKIRAAFNLTPNWFDMPLGQALPHDGAAPTSAPTPMVREATARSEASTGQIIWPFPIVTYRRIQELQAALGPKVGHEAMLDIGKTLEVVTLKWEREALARKSRAS